MGRWFWLGLCGVSATAGLMALPGCGIVEKTQAHEIVSAKRGAHLCGAPMGGIIPLIDASMGRVTSPFIPGPPRLSRPR